MNLSQRERLWVIVALAVVGLLAADSLVVSPLLERRGRLQDDEDRLLRELDQAQLLLRRARNARRQWLDTHAGSLHGSASAAESEMLDAIRQWSYESGLKLVALRPEAAPDEASLGRIHVAVTGNGTMHSAARFLYAAETSPLPVRIVGDMQLGTRQKATDDLTLQVRLSMLYLAPKEKTR